MKITRTHLLAHYVGEGVGGGEDRDMSHFLEQSNSQTIITLCF